MILHWDFDMVALTNECNAAVSERDASGGTRRSSRPVPSQRAAAGTAGPPVAGR